MPDAPSHDNLSSRWDDSVDPMAIFRSGEALFAAGRRDEARSEFRRFLLLYRECPYPGVDIGLPDETGVAPATLGLKLDSVLVPVLFISRLAAREAGKCPEALRTLESLTPPGSAVPADTRANVESLWTALATDAAVLEPFTVPPDPADVIGLMAAVIGRLIRHSRAVSRDDSLQVLYARSLQASGQHQAAEALATELKRRRFYLSELIAPEARHDPRSMGGAMFALGWLRRVDPAAAQVAVEAFNVALTETPATRDNETARLLRLWHEMLRVTSAWDGPDPARVAELVSHRAEPYLVIQRLRQRDPASLSKPSYAYFALQVLALAGDPDAVPIAETLARLRPHSQDLRRTLAEHLLTLVDWPAASRLAWRAEAMRIAARRETARKGPLLVLFEPALWSFGDIAARLDILHHGRRANRIDWFPLVVDAVPENNPRGIANPHLLDAWQPFFPIIRDRALMDFLKAAAATVQHNDGEYFIPDADRCIETSHAIYETYYRAAQDGSPPTLVLSPEDAAWGAETLRREFGIAPGTWFACVHVRGDGWHKDSGLTEKSAKSADPLSYVKAMKSIVEAGGVVFRLGDPSMPRLPGIDGVIDIAHSPHKSQRLDVYLCAASRFGIGTCSGPAAVMAAYGVPLVTTNAVPLDSGSLRPGDLYIHRLLRRTSNGEWVPFAQLMRPPLQETRRPRDLVERGYRLVDNTEDEIDGAVREMLALLKGEDPFSAEDKARQARYQALTVSQPRPMGLVGTPSAYFLRKYAGLLSGRS